MTLHEMYLVYPEGEVQETQLRLSINDVVDLNGSPLDFPLRNPKVIAYRVFKIQRGEERGMDRSFFHLELVSVDELRGM